MIAYNTEKYNRNPVQYPGTYQVEKMELNGVDISSKVIQTDIIESIKFPCLTGRIVVVDTENLISNLPIIGDETLHIIINDETENKIDCKFKIYKISDRSSPNHGVLQYILHFCSEEFYKDTYTKVSKAYMNTPYEDAVKDILETYLESKKPLLSENTNTPQCFIIPNWSALTAINWIAGRSQSETFEYGGGNYIFFETVKGFNFLSLDNLYDQKMNQCYGDVEWNAMRKSSDFKTSYSDRIPDDTMKFETLTVVKSFDMIENIRAGMYANQTVFVDISSGKNTTEEFEYIEDFGKGKHLAGGIANEAFPMTRKDFVPNKKTEALNKVIINHKGLFSQEPEGGFMAKDWLPHKQSQIAQSEQFKIQGTLPGHIGLVAGQQVKFNYMDVSNSSISIDFTPDLYYSGFYIITDVRRTFQGERFTLSIEMIKDSLSLSLEGINV